MSLRASMTRILAVLYGLLALAAAAAISTYQIAFVGNFVLPHSVDRGGQAGSFGLALCINVVLLGLFGLQHSLMARPWFKSWCRKFIPEPIERSTYVLFVVLAYVLLFWQWRPVEFVIWQTSNPILCGLIWTAFFSGWGLLLWSSYLVNPWDMWGFRHVWAYAKGVPYTILNFQASGPYRLVRHPIMLGLYIAFWAAPVMTVGHALFAAAMTAYGMIATFWEERDLLRTYPGYAQYRDSTPMVIPWLRRRSAQ
jgi:methanethiol S-methyltransferase